MFARPWATFCLLNLVVFPAWGAAADAPPDALVVYLTADAGQSPHVLDSLKRELGQLMQTAGYDLVWVDAGTRAPETASPLIVASLHGVCALPAGSAPPAPLEKAVSLGSTALSDGHMLPFSSVNCTALARLLAPSLGAEPPARRDFLFGRAAARVLAHEFYHVLAGDREHAAEGIAKPAFGPADLLAEHLPFEPATLVKLLSRKPASVTETAAGDDSSGRN